MKMLRPLFLLLIVGSFQTDLFSQKVIDQDDPEKAQVFTQDVIVQGSECVGIDCASSESFGFDTGRYKENNLRLHFDDTSNSASFPSNDWRFTFNDSSNGGANYFSVDDATAGRQIFRVDAGAPANSLRVDNNGDVSIGNANAVTELHITDGDSPTIRLEQNGSSGFTPQTWDMAGNETNFFVRDVTNGSKLPFKIKPGAPDNALFVAADGDIGLGTQNPATTASLHIVRTTTANLKIENTTASNGGRVLLDLENHGPTRVDFYNTNANVKWRNQVDNQGRYKLGVANGLGVLTLDDGTGNMTVTGTVTANGVLLTSDLRLKNNVSEFKGGLKEVLQINPINYEFNGKGGFETGKPYVGYGAQELQEIAPYLVHDFQIEKENADGILKSSESYLKIDPMAVQVLLVNAIKDQNELIVDKEERIAELEGEVSDLKNQMEEIYTLLKGKGSQDVTLGTDALLKQNYPNPHEGETVIEYFIPENSTNAQIQIFDATGKLIQSVNIAQKGAGQLNVDSRNIPNGQYTYSLVLDGNISSTKKMTLAK
ncbi:MAG: T9SS type A sorting domain-containing protein [Saprospiraceae bacterium]|nr:tail fiber domain-containing protein [Bacteroidia bacterium]NNE15467.1 T9SS type A sorting domain-containing protein [Saprospiraceae bacterium]NNL92418.1 T9SS type A sorting domain-containing protein [Saprospiraceae bacterium]